MNLYMISKVEKGCVTRYWSLISVFVIAYACSFSLCGCQKITSNSKEFVNADGFPKTEEEIQSERIGKLFGKNIVLWSSKSDDNFLSSLASKKDVSNTTEKDKGVRRYLWPAVLRALVSMPLAVVDHKGGVVTTDWCFIGGNNSSQRYKFNVLIGTAESQEMLFVNVFKEELVKGGWVPVQPSSATRKLSEELKTRIFKNVEEIRTAEG